MGVKTKMVRRVVLRGECFYCTSCVRLLQARAEYVTVVRTPGSPAGGVCLSCARRIGKAAEVKR